MRVIKSNVTMTNLLDNTTKNEFNKEPKTDYDKSTVSVNNYLKVHNTKNEITSEEFESLAKTGDIILLKTKYLSAACKRLFTCDKFDHIFFVYEKSGLITFLDASLDGICLGTDWQNFKNSLAPFDYHIFAYKKLNISEKDILKKKIIVDNIEKNLKEFIKEVRNKHYYISIFNIMCKARPKEFEIKGEWGKCFGFSCSSFIAALYSKLGIIKLKNTAHSFLPGDFERESKMDFLPGFSLEPIKKIVFTTK